MRHLTTKISLYPGVPSTERILGLLRLVFEEYRWFAPERYGLGFMDGKLDPRRIDYDALGALYEERQSLCIAARTDQDFLMIFPAKGDTSRPQPEFPYTGTVSWTTSLRQATQPRWRAEHPRQVQQVMALLGSPLAQAATAEELDRKTNRLVPAPDGLGQVQEFTVRDYSEGLAGLYWRNFLGPPFLRLFGERLDTLPAECHQVLSEELVLVQPYELPAQAGTPEGDMRERQLISLLGADCFYEHERHVKPTRRPVLGPPVR